MLVPQLYLNGRSEEALEIYCKVFKTKIDSIMYDPEREPQKFVVHAEIKIDDQRVMVSDWGGNLDMSSDSALQLVVIFKGEDQLKEAYEQIKDQSRTIIPLGETFYSSCVVDFLDKFGVRWCFMV